MNTHARPQQSISLTLTAVLCATSLLVNSCTTQSTANLVATQPMNKDLEKQVLNETGISGAAAGAAIGAVTGALISGLITKASGGDSDQVRRSAITGGVIGGVSGGYIGYQKGQQAGQQIIAKGMERDKLGQLLAGAREQNRYLANYNAGLREQIDKARKISDPKQQKVAYASLRNQSNKQLKEANARIAMRDRALENEAWTSNQKSGYRAERNDLVKKRNDLVASINQVSKLDQAVVY